uniref:helix-turn-helix transcriptional regulator n=1 Tax=Ningiella ruwaisensis TaxID=2364274 RepID=UPI00109F4818|nr:AAA family ATPase [Ningiella ruwaisensis]
MPLLEREQALSQLSNIAQDLQRSGKVVLLSGEAGVGKTSLLEQMRYRLSSDIKTVWSGCDPLFTPRPFSPLHDLSHVILGKWSELLESTANNKQINALSSKLAHALYEELEKLESPMIIVIEDLHWADHATLDLLKFLVRRIAFMPCLLCLSYRDEAITSEHPFRTLLNLFPSAHTKRILLEPLSLKSVEELAQSSGHDAKNLYQVTAGNPFFVTEILANTDTSPNSIPSSVCDAIVERVSHLSCKEQAFIQTLSLIPYAAPLALLDHLFENQAQRLSTACIERKILQFDSKGDLRFVHELARLATLEKLSLHQQKALHKKILSSLEDLKLLDNLAWLTHHAEGAKDATSMLKYANLAAANAASLGAHKEAASYYEKALRFVEYADTQLAAELYENWAYETGLTKHLNESVIQARRSAITLWRALNRIDKIGENLRYLSRLYWYQGKAERAEHYANEAIQTFEQLPAGSELAMAYSMRSQLDMLNERTEEAILWGNKALELERRFRQPLVKVHALTNIGTALLMTGDVKGEALIQESLQLAKQHAMHEEAARVYTNYADYSVRFKRLALAESIITQGIQYDVSHDLSAWTYYLVGIQAQLRLEEGRIVDAQTIAAGVQELENQTMLMKLPALIVLARARSRLASADAEKLLIQAHNNAMAIDEPQYFIPTRLAIIEWAWLNQQHEYAAQYIKDLFKLAPSIMNSWQLGELLAWAYFMGLDIPEGFEENNLRKNLPAAYQAELADDAELAFDRWQSLGMPFNAALALLKGLIRQTLVPNAEICMRLSALLNSMHAKAGLIRLKQHAQFKDYYHLLPKEKRGPYAKSRQHPIGLTAKEQAVLKLIVAGNSNQEIANALSRSQRTIENHVSSILAKMQVENRVEVMLRVQNEPWLNSD